MKEYLTELIGNSLAKAGFEPREVHFDTPKEEKFGDLSTNIAMLLAKEMKQPPRAVAQKILDSMETDPAKISKVEIAGAGFINFFMSDEYFKSSVHEILAKGDSYGKSDLNAGRTSNIEWISANPTGPLHTGHGRNACLGKAIANLMEWTGYSVTREYYYNDAGNQMNNLARSVYARYMQIMDPSFGFPEDGYAGDYVKDIARKIYDEKGESLKQKFDRDFFAEEGEKHLFGMIRGTLEKMGIKHDVFFNESSLYEDGTIDATVTALREKGMAYDREGAVWLKMDESEGFQKDKVIVKSTGEPTYRLPDMAYHIHKLKRGFDLVVDIFGSDHGDTYREVLYGVKSLGYDNSRIKVIIHQMVTFRMGDESVKMSKRSDKVYSLDELINDIGVDATQFFFIMRGANTHLDFDISLAKDKSEKNPVYYLQYAHARICGILRNAAEHLGFSESSLAEMSFSLSANEDELRLLKVLGRFPGEVESAASTFEPHKIIIYLNELAESFHRFYHNNRIVDAANRDLSMQRIMLCVAARQVFRNAFGIIGVSAPERM